MVSARGGKVVQRSCKDISPHDATLTVTARVVPQRTIPHDHQIVYLLSIVVY